MVLLKAICHDAGLGDLWGLGDAVPWKQMEKD
jgi:hypothetical protein